MKPTHHLSLACVLACACASGPRNSGPTVIVAGSVCSGLPALALSAPPAPADPSEALLVYVPDGKSELVLYDVAAQRERYRVPARLRTRPQLLGDVVVALDAQGQLSGYDAKSGVQRFAVAVDRANFLGAVQLGNTLIYNSSSLSFRPSERGSTVSAIDSRTGEHRWQRRVPYALSRPRLFGQHVLVISDHADVWALTESGADAGCARLDSDPVDWLAQAGSELVVGANGARKATGPGDRLAPPLMQLPGRPALRVSDYDVAPAGRSAHGRVGVTAELAAGPGLALANGGYSFVFYRDVFGYRQDGQLSWARWLDSDVVRTQLAGDALVLATEEGTVTVLDAATGALRSRITLRGPLASADLHFTQTPAVTTQTAAPPLRQALAEIALDSDARLLPARLLAVDALAALPDASASADLLHIYTQPGTPEALRERVVAVLPKRSVGLEHLIDALLEDYDFLEDRQAPPLAAIVPSLLAAHDARGVPRLVERLFDPDTRPAELTTLVEAIADLGGQDASVPLTKFLAMYHADSSFSADASPLTAAARALAERATADSPEAALLDRLAADANSLPPLRAQLAARQTKQSVAGAPTAPAAEVAAGKTALPEVLSDQAIRQVFVGKAESLRGCVLAELTRNPDLRSVRLSFVVESSGEYAALQVLPDHPELLHCLKLGLAQLRFPPFRAQRRMASYTIAVHPDAVSAALAQPMAAGAEQPFWTLSLRRAGYDSTIPNVAPWWQDANPLFVAIDEAEPDQHPLPNQVAPPAQPLRPVTGQQPPVPPPSETQAKEDTWWLPVPSK